MSMQTGKPWHVRTCSRSFPVRQPRPAPAIGVVLVLTTLAAPVGSAELAGNLLVPALMLIGSMFFTSLYFTFHYRFELPEPTIP
jgi:hypothetical protein